MIRSLAVVAQIALLLVPQVNVLTRLLILSLMTLLTSLLLDSKAD